jgi:hypothetical protein
VAGIAAPVIAGLAVGICSIVILALALHPKLLVTNRDVDIVSLPAYQQQAVEKAKESRVFHLFQEKHPFTYVRSASNETLNMYDGEGNLIESEQVVQVVFLGDSATATLDFKSPTQTYRNGAVCYDRPTWRH